MIELFGDVGERLLFELLDVIEYKSEKYEIITPYFVGQEKYDTLLIPPDIFVMKIALSDDGEDVRVIVERKSVKKAVYKRFMKKSTKMYQ